jgi:hypothetical protein
MALVLWFGLFVLGRDVTAWLVVLFIRSLRGVGMSCSKVKDI